MMERQQILATMGELKLYGMKAAYDEIIKMRIPMKPAGDSDLMPATVPT
jgi:hypothetical protein